MAEYHPYSRYKWSDILAPAQGDALGIAWIPIAIGAGILITALTGTALLKAAAELVKQWRAGDVEPVKAQQDAQRLVQIALQAKIEGKITEKEYVQIVDTLAVSAEASGSGFFQKYGATIGIGVLTALATAIVFRMLK